MAIDSAALKTLIAQQAAGSDARTAYAAGNDAGVAAALNALPGAGTTRDMTFGEWQAWAVKSDTLDACRTAANMAAPLSAPQAAAKKLGQKVLDIYAASLAVMYYADVSGFGSGLVTAGLLSQDGLTSLLNSLTVTRSKPQELWGQAVTPDDVYRTRSMP